MCPLAVKANISPIIMITSKLTQYTSHKYIDSEALIDFLQARISFAMQMQWAVKQKVNPFPSDLAVIRLEW